MTLFGRKTCRGFGVVFWAVCLVWLLAVGSDVWGQQRSRGRTNARQDREVAEEAKNVQKISETVLDDFISQNIPLVTEDIEAIEKELEISHRYLGRFSSEQKAYYYLVQAYLNHFSGNSGKEAVLLAQKAYDSDSENMDAANSLIALSLYYGKYSIARKVLQELDAGEAVVIESKPDDRKKDSLANSSSSGSNEPNSLGRAHRFSNDPNTGGYRASRNGARGNTKPEKKNRWAQKRRQQKQRPGMMPGMGPGQPGMPPGMMPGMGPGMGPGMQPGYQMQPRKPVVRRRRSSGKTHLDLPYEYMPYAHLGETFQSLNVRNVNGSFYQFDSGQGEVLCVLLWTLPENGGASRHAPRRTPSNMAVDQMPVQKVADDLWGNVDQFRELYRFHRQSGKAQFVTVNLDAATSRNVRQVEELFIESSWPWVNFMAQDAHQAEAWEIKELYSQVMVIVDPAGTIRYMGPVGGFLPLMLLESQLDQVKPNQPVAQSASDKNAKKPTHVSKVEGESKTAAAPKGKAKQPARRSAKSSEKNSSNPQAQQMLQAARVKKRISLRGAMNIYDDILSRFGDSQEAEIAKMQIKSICRKNSRLKKERMKQGKYTGFE